MERATVIRSLQAWVDGVDAASGETLPVDHPGQRPETLRVIFAALALLEAVGDGPRRELSRGDARAAPRNAGRPWSEQDDAVLANAFDAGEPVGALAARLERTRGAINSRLALLGKIELPPGMRLRGEIGTPSRRDAGAPFDAAVGLTQPG